MNTPLIVGSPESETPRAGMHRAVGIILTIVLVLALGPLVLGTLVWRDMQTLPGNPSSFDPVGSFLEIEKFAGDGARLIAMDAKFVRRDGTLDLKARYTPAPSVAYRFVQEGDAPKNAPPIGAGAVAGGTWNETVLLTASRPWQFKTYRKIDSHKRVQFQYFNLGIEKDTLPAQHGRLPEAILAPTCQLKTLWDAAAEAGAPEDAVANITYDRNGYAFTVNGTNVRMEFDTNCKQK